MSSYQAWPVLKPNDIVDIIAPASGCPPQENAIPLVQKTLTEWGLIPNIPTNIYGKDLLCANSDEQRFTFLKNALLNSDSKAIWALRGGYGCSRILNQLSQISKPKQSKLFIGMSDVTALHLFLQKQWNWATLHGPSARQIATKSVNEENITEIKNIIFGKTQVLKYDLSALNSIAKQKTTISAPITGGNLCLVQASIGTCWQMDSRNKVVFLEETNERGYRVDRMLTHLSQAGLFNEVAGVILGDFTGGNEPDGTNLVNAVLTRFAENSDFPVLRCHGIGHDSNNRPLAFGIPADLTLGTEPQLQIKLL